MFKQTSILKKTIFLSTLTKSRKIPRGREDKNYFFFWFLIFRIFFFYRKRERKCLVESRERNETPSLLMSLQEKKPTFLFIIFQVRNDIPKLFFFVRSHILSLLAMLKVASTIIVARRPKTEANNNVFQVLFVKRHDRARFMPSAHVFPGFFRSKNPIVNSFFGPIFFLAFFLFGFRRRSRGF